MLASVFIVLKVDYDLLRCSYDTRWVHSTLVSRFLRLFVLAAFSKRAFVSLRYLFYRLWSAASRAICRDVPIETDGKHAFLREYPVSHIIEVYSIPVHESVADIIFVSIGV